MVEGSLRGLGSLEKFGRVVLSVFRDDGNPTTDCCSLLVLRVLVKVEEEQIMVLS